MQGRYFKKFEGLNSVFSIQTGAILLLNNLTDHLLIADEKVFYKEGYIVAYMFQADINRIRDFVFANIKTDPDYLNKVYKTSVSKFEDFDKRHDILLKEIDDMDDPEELRTWLSGFLDLSMDTVSLAYFAELFTGYDEFWLGYTGLAKSDFDILISPEELSYTKKYDFDLSKIKLGKSTKTASEIAEEYYWIHGNYSAVDKLQNDEVINQLEKMSLTDAKKAFDEDEAYTSDVTKRKEIIWRNNSVTASNAKIINAISSFIVLQDKRKSIALKTNFIFLKAVNKLLDMYTFSSDEKKKIISSAYPVWFTEMEKDELLRMSRSAYDCFYLSFTGQILVGDEALKIYKEEEEITNMKDSAGEIKGRTAFAGKVKGVVRIIVKGEDFPKFKDGEILVTHMTRPEFVPLIKKSIAVITDEGGITCHAAIISRELKIPCIIGTMNATLRLKDGDIVEVDANNGIVRIIK
jgi:phosphohistidine swiveling domain-containing protein